MRLLFGIILGFALTVGGVYVADQVSTPRECPPDGQLGCRAEERRRADDDGARRLAPHQRLTRAAHQSFDATDEGGRHGRPFAFLSGVLRTDLHQSIEFREPTVRFRTYFVARRCSRRNIVPRTAVSCWADDRRHGSTLLEERSNETQSIDHDGSSRTAGRDRVRRRDKACSAPAAPNPVRSKVKAARRWRRSKTKAKARPRPRNRGRRAKAAKRRASRVKRA